MVSRRKIAANRRNAEKSTGPRSSAGKARSRGNALTHGLTAQHLLLPNEDPAVFEALRGAMFIALAPQDALEDQLVERLVSLVWRLRRVPAFEVALFAWMTHYQEKLCDPDDGFIINPDIARRFLPETSAEIDDHSSATPHVLEIGRTLEALLNTDLTSKLSRYETSLQRQLSLTLRELRERQANRSDRSKGVDAVG